MNYIIVHGENGLPHLIPLTSIHEIEAYGRGSRVIFVKDAISLVIKEDIGIINYRYKEKVKYAHKSCDCTEES